MVSDSRGESLRTKLESVWRQTGTKPANWEEEPEFPAICQDVWLAFIRLHNSRPQALEGLTPILYSEISAYSQLYKVDFDEWELHLIQRFDKIAQDSMPKQTPKPQKTK